MAALSALRRLLLGADDTPGWLVVGHAEPERHLEVWLHGFGEPVDVSDNHVMVALVPFLVAIRLDVLSPEDRAIADASRPWLSVREPDGRELARVRLRPAREVEVPPYRLGLFETAGCDDRNLPAVRLHAHYLLQRWKHLQDRNPYNMKMASSPLFCSFALYSAPRPVVLVSHQSSGRGNVVPLDLVGEAGAPCYLLGVHDSPALVRLAEAERLAVSTVPLAWSDTAVALGRNHRHETIDWAGLPFATVPSPTWGIPVPAGALTVREVRVERLVRAGSHTIFVTTTERLERWAEGLQTCYIHGFHQMYLERQGRPLPVPAGPEEDRRA
jgi:flavin reductase (DIM6/NTAB) family NADH-FMN oxidoreductase RutF